MAVAGSAEEQKNVLEGTECVHNEFSLGSLGLNSNDHREVSVQSVPGVEEAFVYDGLFSVAECVAIQAALNGVAAWRPANVKKSVRDCDRQVVISTQLAELIAQRLNLQANLPCEVQERNVTKEYTASHGAEIGTEGTWRLGRVNEMFRAASYGNGGHFTPHRDAMILPSEGERSFFSLLVYLSDEGFSGGETAFVKDGDGFSLEYGKYDPNEHVDAKVAPKAGRCLIFNQSLLHAGSPVVCDETEGAETGGRKVILISELFFTLSAAPAPEETWNPASVELLRRAQALDEEGDYMGAIEAYNRLRYSDPDFAVSVGVP